MKMANELKLGKGKDFVKNRKKAICAGGLGILLLAGIGLGVSSLVSAETAKTKVSVSSGVASTYEDTENDEGVSTSQDKKESSKDGVTKEAAINGETTSKEIGTEQTTDKVETTGSETVSKESGAEQATDKASTPQGSSTYSTSNTDSTSKGSSTASTSNTASTSKDSSTSQTSSSGVSTPSHSHSWSPVTSVVNHEASGHWKDVVVKAAWSEEVPTYENKARDICNTCNADITGTSISAHVKQHMLAGEDKGGHRTTWKKVQVGTKTVSHQAVYDKKWVVDKQAWSETVTNGHKCSCGSTK